MHHQHYSLRPHIKLSLVYRYSIAEHISSRMLLLYAFHYTYLQRTIGEPLTKVWVKIALCLQSKQSAILASNAPFCTKKPQNFHTFGLPLREGSPLPALTPARPLAVRRGDHFNLTPTFKYLPRL